MTETPPGTGVGDQEAAGRRVADERIKRKRPVAGIDRIDRFLQLAIGQDRQDRTEDLAPHQFHLRRHVQDNVRRELALRLVGRLTLGEIDELRAFGARVIECGGKPII